MDEETYPVRTYGIKHDVTRSSILRFLNKMGPRGADYIAHGMYSEETDYGDFVEACRHFGLEHRLIDITGEEIINELAARRARRAKPTARRLVGMELEEWQEEADARMDIYERRVAEAEAKIAAGASRKEITA